MTKTSALGLLLAPAIFLLTGCDIEGFGPSDRYQENFHYSWDLKPGGSLNIENMNGQIEIYGSDSATTVDVSGVRYAATEEMLKSIRIETHNSPESIDIRTIRPSGFRTNGGARYTIRVPRKILLDRIISSNGGIQVRGITGRVRLRTSNGAIHADDVTGDLEAHTSNGAIDLQSIAGEATLATSNGRISAEDVSGQVQAETSNGGISVRMREAPSAATQLHTSNGSIELTMDRTPRAGIRAETSNGGITLRLPANTSATLRAETSGSNISSDFDVANHSRDDDHRNHLDGAIGSGGPAIDLHSSHGHIRILKGSAN